MLVYGGVGIVGERKKAGGRVRERERERERERRGGGREG